MITIVVWAHCVLGLTASVHVPQGNTVHFGVGNPNIIIDMRGYGNQKYAFWKLWIRVALLTLRRVLYLLSLVRVSHYRSKRISNTPLKAMEHVSSNPILLLMAHVLSWHTL